MESDSRLVALEPLDLEKSPTGEVRTRHTPHVFFGRLERARPGSETYTTGLATGNWPIVYRVRKQSLPTGFCTSWQVLTEDGTSHDVTSIIPVAVPARSDWQLITLVQRTP